MNNPLDVFAWKVRSERKRQHLTQKQLAERLGMNPRTIIDLETGKSNPKFETVVLVAKELNISVDAAIFPEMVNQCIFRPSESKETVGVSPPSREKQVQVHGRESTGVLFWKEMAKERFAKRSSACHLFRLESFSFAHGVISIDEDLVGTVLNPVQHSIC